MIKIVKSLEEAFFVTHSGKFHADDVFSVILLEKVFKDVSLIRLPEVDNIDVENRIVFDIGGGKFDHHQPGANGQRDNGFKYAAFGLLWKEYGKKYLESITDQNVDVCFEIFDKNFVQFIDASDNGQIDYESVNIKVISVSDVIERFNPKWDEEIDSDICFEKVLSVAREIFDENIKSAIAKCKAKKFVDEAINNSQNGIMILSQYMPYEEFVHESKDEKAKDILYVVLKSNRGGYNARCISKKIGSFECRKRFPQSWAGLRNEELQNVTGVKSATFCHNACFICSASDLEGAIELAKIAVEN